jgi:hypothetical protein
MFCSGCGKETEKDVLFCSGCGKKINGDNSSKKMQDIASRNEEQSGWKFEPNPSYISTGIIGLIGVFYFISKTSDSRFSYNFLGCCEDCTTLTIVILASTIALGIASNGLFKRNDSNTATVTRNDEAVESIRTVRNTIKCSSCKEAYDSEMKSCPHCAYRPPTQASGNVSVGWTCSKCKKVNVQSAKTCHNCDKPRF